MIDTKIYLEKKLQDFRFSKVKPYLKEDVLDFGGNEGELKSLVKGKYLVVNYDHSVLNKVKKKSFDVIVTLAVIEHIEFKEVFKIFKKLKPYLRDGGRVFLTTPTPPSKPVLEFLAWIGLLQKENIDEHKHYWNKKELYDLAKKTGFKVKKYKKFQLGFNQLALFEN